MLMPPTEIGCCPTCGRPYVSEPTPHASTRQSAKGKPAQRELREQARLSDEARAALSTKDLYAYCARWAPVDDLLFVRSKASPELQAQIDQLLELPRKIARAEVNQVFDARRRELSPELPAGNEAEFWRYWRSRSRRARGVEFRTQRDKA